MFVVSWSYKILLSLTIFLSHLNHESDGTMPFGSIIRCCDHLIHGCCSRRKFWWCWSELHVSFVCFFYILIYENWLKYIWFYWNWWQASSKFINVFRVPKYRLSILVTHYLDELCSFRVSQISMFYQIRLFLLSWVFWGLYLTQAEWEWNECFWYCLVPEKIVAKIFYQFQN